MEISFTPTQVKSEFREDRNLLFLMGMIFFLLLVFSGLKIYNTQLRGQISIVEEEIEKIDKERDKDLEKEMKEKMPLLEKARIVLDSHTRAKNVFDLLEKKTFSDVRITNFVFNAEDNTVIISTESSSDIALAMQTSIFKSTPEIKSVEIGGISKEEGVFKFQFKLTLDEKVIKFSTKIE